MKKACLFIFFGLFVLSANTQELSRMYQKNTIQGQLLSLNGTRFESSEAGVMMQESSRTEPRPWSFYGVVNVSGAFSLNQKATLFGVEFIGGFRWGHFTHFGMGIGMHAQMGAELYSNIPFFIELRNTYLRSKVSPYTTINLGYAFPNGRARNASTLKSGVVQGGPLVGLSVGARYVLSRRATVNLGIGYNCHLSTIAEYYLIGGDLVAEQEVPSTLHQIKLIFGLMF